MSPLDYGTILRFGLCPLAFFSLVVFLATVKRGHTEFRLWTAANLSFIVSRVVLSFDPALPSIIGIFFSDGFAFFSFAAFAATSIYILSGRPPILFFGALAAVAMAALAVFSWLAPNGHLGSAAMSVAIAAATARSSLILGRLARKIRLRSEPALLVAMFAAIAVFYLARGTLHLIDALDPGFEATKGLDPSMDALFAFAMMISLNFILVVILMTHLEREITGKVIEMGESRNELQILYDALLDTAGTVDLEELMPKILDLLIARLHAGAAAIYLGDKVSDEPVLTAQRGLDVETIALIMRPQKGSSVVAIAFEEKRSATWTIADYPEGPIREALTRQGLVALGGFPILASGEVLGVLALGYRKAEALDKSRTALLATLALQIGIVLRAATLHEELDRANARLDVLASTDPLTGLANRRTALCALESEKNRALRSKAKIAVIMCDIDHFKDFNDRHGHECGDFVLANTATIIGETLRKADIAARWGGEEFLVILGNAEPSGVAILAERLRKRVETARWDYEGKFLSVTMTLGAVICAPETRSEAVIALADEALYEGKRCGRNRVIVRGDPGVEQEDPVLSVGDAAESANAPEDEASDLLPLED